MRPVKDNNTLFYFCACKKAFACGKSNIQSHENTTKHVKALVLLKFDNERMSSQIASDNNLNDSLPSMHNVFDDECTETSSFGSVPVLDSLPSEAVKETDDILKSKDLDFTKRVSLAELRLALFFVEKNISFEVGKDLVELLLELGRDPGVLEAVSLGPTKLSKIVNNVLASHEMAVFAERGRKRPPP